MKSKEEINVKKPPHLIAADLLREIENMLMDSGAGIKFGERYYDLVTAYVEAIQESASHWNEIEQPEPYQIYTDGSCSPNPGCGGYGVVVVNSKGVVIDKAWGGVADSTNQRMEILAAIEGLKMVDDKSMVWLWSDSQYVVNTMEQGWKRKANYDLWSDLDEQAARVNVTFRWLRGHDGNEFNELADRLSTRGREDIRAKTTKNQHG